MEVQKEKDNQNQQLKELCINSGIKYDSLVSLLESVKFKKFVKRNNYHQEKINDEIEKAIR